MNPIHREYCYDRPYVHSWPGQAKTRKGNKHNAARKAAFKAKHA